jgi:adenylosuccinate synthase
MAHKIDLVMDFQYGSTGKGLIAGYLAHRENYDTAICAFGTQAGHSYYNKAVMGDRLVMVQQLPIGIVSPSVRNIMIGPGAIISAEILMAELERFGDLMAGKRLMIHPHAAVLDPSHADFEIADGRTKMGSTAKGVGEAVIERIRRKPDANIVKNRWRDGHPLARYVSTVDDYREALYAADTVLMEGAQGFSLSLYHGQYPHVTSRDVTPWQIAADCGLPFNVASTVQVIGSMRTLPIRVNNRDGSSGPCYPDQEELDWSEVAGGIAPELTTVTKLPRRIFTFSQRQLTEAMFHCGGYWNTRIFLNFCNYIKPRDLDELVAGIECPRHLSWNAPRVAWLGFGPDDSDVVVRDRFISAPDSEGGEL